MKPQWVLLLLLLLSILLSGQTLTENKARISSGFFLLRKCISDHSQEEQSVGRGEDRFRETGCGGACLPALHSGRRTGVQDHPQLLHREFKASLRYLRLLKSNDDNR